MSDSIKLSVVLPTYNPEPVRLEKVLNQLQEQCLSLDQWELLIVNNNSSDKKVFDDLRPHWHPNHQIIEENRQGLTHARLAGFEASKGEIIVLADDDNLLEKDYLSNALNIFDQQENLGAAGGKIHLKFEESPPNYIHEYTALLAGRDFGDEVKVGNWKSKKEYPLFSPIGAGMVLRKKALENYIKNINTNENLIMDRTADNLSSAGDNDIVMQVLSDGFDVGYFPDLSLKHLIPKERTTIEYLKKINFSTSCSWVVVTHKHGICPWSPIQRWTVKPRQLRAWFRLKAWKDDQANIHWHGACGIFEGRSLIK